MRFTLYILTGTSMSIEIKAKVSQIEWSKMDMGPHDPVVYLSEITIGAIRGLDEEEQRRFIDTINNTADVKVTFEFPESDEEEEEKWQTLCAVSVENRTISEYTVRV